MLGLGHVIQTAVGAQERRFDGRSSSKLNSFFNNRVFLE